MKPFFSIVIPTYQSCEKLKIALQSVLLQTYQNFEVLIIDDGSTDNTGKMLAQFKDSRFFYHRIKNSGGPARPRNIGIKYAKSDWIAFLDSDDTWTKNKLEEIFNYISNAVDLIYHDMEIISKDKSLDKKIIKSAYLNTPKLKDLLLRGNTINLSSAVVRKSILERVNYFNKSINMRASEDYNLWLKISQISDNFLYLPKKLGYYSIHKKNISHQDMSIPRFFAIKEFLYLLSEDEKIKLEAKLKYNSGYYYYQKKNYEKAKKNFYFAIKYSDNFIKIKALIRLAQTVIKIILKDVDPYKT
jgi:glycosyltransferase involved in cell wall biosynthesis